MEIDKTVKYISKLAKQLKNEDSFKTTVMSKLKNDLNGSINFRLDKITNEQNDQATYTDLLQVNDAADALLNNSVFSTDGSTLEADRDLPIEFAAINVGYVNINYGDGSGAEFDSALSFYPDPKIQEIDSRVLSDVNSMSALRHVMEMEYLVDKMEAFKTDSIKLGFIDGNFYPNFALSHINNNSLKQLLIKRLKAVAEKVINLAKHNTYIVSYNSSPKSVHITSKMDTKISSDFRDSEIFTELLEDNQRSATFNETSDDTDEKSLTPISFVYLKNSYEIAKVEFIKDTINKDAMDKIHSLVQSQVQKGKGYPKILVESHEQ
ncbi:MAG: DNA double-strand break repair nuclease NurA, partial [SAR202 cluster bacterium]|nr:DNA double-strand break repair nuclease NurA [SAR202 cluster bacterium]